MAANIRPCHDKAKLQSLSLLSYLMNSVAKYYAQQYIFKRNRNLFLANSKSHDIIASQVVLLLLLVSSNAAEYNGVCKSNWPLTPRPHSVSVSEFGAVGDGKTINTVAFQNAIFYLKSFADKGGAQLYVPAGKWLTGCITLTSYLTLFLEKDAIILGSEVPHYNILKSKLISWK